MAQWIEVSDVTSRWREGKPPVPAIITVAIDDIEDYLAIQGGTEDVINERILSGDITENTVKRVLSNAVIRNLLEPQNTRLSNWNESVSGAFSQSQTYTQGARNSLLLTDAEIRSLLGRMKGDGARMGALYQSGGAVNYTAPHWL